MKRSFVSAAMTAALLAGSLLVPGGARSQAPWAEFSKKLVASCEKHRDIVKDMTMTMEMTTFMAEASVASEATAYQKGKSFRVEMSVEGMAGAGLPQELAGLKTIVVGNDTKAWIINPMMGKSEIPVDEGNKYSGQMACDAYIPVDAEILGSEKIAGRDCYVLGVLDPNAIFSKLWIDQESYNLMKAEGSWGEGEKATSIFSDYRKIAGDLEYPFKTEVYSGADLLSAIVVKSLEVNNGLSDDLFDPDKVEAQGPDLQNMLKKMQDRAKGEKVD